MTGPGASLKTIRFSFAAAPALRENNTTRSYSNGYYPAYCLLYVHIRSNHWAKREDANAWKERVHWRLIITKCVREERPMLHTALLLFHSARFLSFTCRGKKISSFSFSSSYILSPIFEGERGGNSTESGKAFLYTDGYINSDAPPYLKQQRSYVYIRVRSSINSWRWTFESSVANQRATI